MSKNLTVYMLNLDDGSRRIVATDSKSKASKLFGVSIYILNNRSETVIDPDLVELALSDPGAVWAKQPDASKWSKIVDSRKAAQLPARGGWRPGAGTKPVGKEPGKNRGLRMDDETYESFKRLGGTRYLRQTVAAELTLDDSEWEKLRALGGAKWLRKQLTTAKVK